MRQKVVEKWVLCNNLGCHYGKCVKAHMEFFWLFWYFPWCTAIFGQAVNPPLWIFEIQNIGILLLSLLATKYLIMKKSKISYYQNSQKTAWFLQTLRLNFMQLIRKPNWLILIEFFFTLNPNIQHWLWHIDICQYWFNDCQRKFC